MNAGVERYEEKRRRKGKKFKLILPVLFFILLGGTVINPAMCKNSFADTINLGSANVMSASSYLLKSEKSWLKKKRLQVSNESVKIIGSKEIKLAGPVGGATAALSFAPGVNVSTYGGVNSSKASISINGVKTGWAGFSGGNFDNGSIGITFDGIPMINPGNGLWQADLVPQNSLINSIAVTEGPGSVINQWYNNIGGSINFVPIAPSMHSGEKVALTYGSFNAFNTSFSLQTGNIGGWETVFAGGIGAGNNYMTAPDGFKSPYNNYAYYIKSRRSFFNGGRLSLGVYAARSAAQRPLPTPVNPIPGVSINGYQQAGPLFSENTTGFYTTLPYAVNNKVDSNQIAILYGKLKDPLGKIVNLHNIAYYVEGSREHVTSLHDYVPGSESREELNNPHSYWLGDKIWFTVRAPKNTISTGGFLQTSRYKSQEDLYNSSLGFINSPQPTALSGSAAVPNGPYFSDIFHQLDASVFIKDTMKPLPGLRITPSLRYIDFSTDFSPNEQAAFPLALQLNPGGDATTQPPSSSSFSQFAPSIGTNWHPLSWLALYASYEQAYRQPENGGGTGPYVVIPESQIKLERADYYQAGVKMLWPKLSFAKHTYADVDAFHLNFSNEILPTALSSFGFLLAKGDSIYNGLNVVTGTDIGNNLHAFANAAFIHAYFHNFINGTGTFQGVPVAYVPDMTLNLGIAGRYLINSIKLKPSVTFQYNGSQYMYNNSTNITSRRTVPSYDLVNLGLDLKIPMPKNNEFIRSMNVNAQVYNLFDKEYNAFEYVSAGGAYGSGGYTNPTSVGAGSILAYPGAPRAFYVTVSANF